jgi:hypothetical protein
MKNELEGLFAFKSIRREARARPAENGMFLDFLEKNNMFIVVFKAKKLSTTHSTT